MIENFNIIPKIKTETKTKDDPNRAESISLSYTSLLSKMLLKLSCSILETFSLLENKNQNQIIQDIRELKKDASKTEDDILYYAVVAIQAYRDLELNPDDSDKKYNKNQTTPEITEDFISKEADEAADEAREKMIKEIIRTDLRKK